MTPTPPFDVSGLGYADPGSSVTVHWCSPDLGHRSHNMLGVGRVPGWYVWTRRGCIVETDGPYDTEAEAQAAGDSGLADQKARGL